MHVCSLYMRLYPKYNCLHHIYIHMFTHKLCSSYYFHRTPGHVSALTRGYLAQQKRTSVNMTLEMTYVHRVHSEMQE